MGYLIDQSKWKDISFNRRKWCRC